MVCTSMLAGQDKTHRKIKTLPSVLIDQIAAGEVVERPASVVKELLENSLDAGATNIEVRLKDGGCTEIEIVDDGHGISPVDLPHAIERHSTSKLRELSDLMNIGTFGFRGEALSSIASVSDLTLQSRTREEPGATQIHAKYGKVDETRPAGGAVGTRITIKQLFEKVPARKKFLRAQGTELSYCVKAIKEIAVGNPNVRFTVVHQGRTVHRYTAPNVRDRLKECLRWDWEPLFLEDEREGMQFSAYLSPTHRIADRGEVLVYINGRSIKNRQLQFAVKAAYQDTLGPHHVPSGVIYFEVRPDWVDVNVHPQKLEVRLLKQERFHGWLTAFLRKALATKQTVRPFKMEEPQRSYQPSLTDDAEPLVSESSPTLNTMDVAPNMEQQPLLDDSPTENKSDHEQISSFRYLGQVKASYLLGEDDEGLLVVDQHALHEKLAFEELLKKHKKGLDVQKLLVPKVLTLSPEEMALFETRAPLLSEIGFEIERFGDHEVAVHSRPALLEESRIDGVVHQILDDLSDTQRSATEVLDDALRPLFATLACHSVVRANHTLTPVEAEFLLKRLPEIELGWTCPHGRPVMFRINFKDLEKHFERC